MNLEREWIRGAAPLAVLTLLREGEMYGYELVEALEHRSGGLLELGQSTVYPLLYNLADRGYVEPVRRTAPSGRKRKYYRLTPAGERWLEGQRSQWEALVEALRRLGIEPGPGARPRPGEASP
ncbi:MAG: PadR family transcriptional regulator [Gemmatimonadota bacterium]